MDGNSLNITTDLILKLKEIIPGAFTENKLDISQLKQLLGEDVNTDSERYQISWAGKNEAYKVLQIPTTSTLIPNIEDSTNWDIAENIFIEGENLEVLKILQKSYYGKIKMIYIDPPYNTGSDSFIYPDKFKETKEDYLKRLGEKNDDGILMKEGFFKSNRKENGQFHSNWLSMMLPRLFLARNLMSDDGFIHISIDDNELSTLKLLMDEVFGEENFRNILLVRRYDKNINTQFLDEGLKTFNTGAEYILIYSKNALSKMNPVFREASEDRKANGYWKGFWNGAERKTMQYTLLGISINSGQWKWKEEVAQEAVKNYEIFLKDYSSKLSIEEYWMNTGCTKKFIKKNPEGKGQNKGVEHWIAPNDKILRNTLWQDIFASKVPKGYDIPFNNPKNPELIKLLMEITFGDSTKGIVLDFFGGSGTTAHSVLEYNNINDTDLKFITIQLPELIDENHIAFSKKFRLISEITVDRIKTVINNLSFKDENELNFKGVTKKIGFKFFRLNHSNFKIWRSEMVDSEEDLIIQTNLFNDPLKLDTNHSYLLWELIIKSGYSLTSKVENIAVDNSLIYFISEFRTIIILDKYSEKIQKEIISLSPKKVICLDTIFNNDDCLKTNAILKLEQEGILFQSI